MTAISDTEARQETRPSTRDRILDACHALFIERGAANVSVEDVAIAAGVGRATIYRHFADREEMVDAEVARSRGRLASRMQQVVIEHESFIDRVAELAGIFADLAGETRIDTRRRDLHDHHLADVFVSGIDRIIADTTDFIEPLVARGVERGELEGGGLDVRGYADWVTRMLVAILLVPGSCVIDIRDPQEVADYVRTNLLAGRAPVRR